MMKKKSTINDVLNKHNFNENEKRAFTDCINKVKEEQKNGINAENEIKKIIEEIDYNEI